MARIANLDKNPRVAHYSVSGDAYKTYNVTLNDTFYRKLYRGDAVNCYIHGEERIKLLQELITKLESRLPEEFAITSYSIGSSTLSGAHDQIDKLLTLEGWHQYRAAMISAIRDEIKQEEEYIKANEREQRERACYSDGNETDVAKAIISGNFDMIMDYDYRLHGICGNTAKSIVNSTMTVSEWKERELNRLRNIHSKLDANILLLEQMNVDDVQDWFNELKRNASTYIETGT